MKRYLRPKPGVTVHYHTGGKDIPCPTVDCPTRKDGWANPDRQVVCKGCQEAKWRREEFDFMDQYCRICAPAACLRGDHSVDFDGLGRGFVTTFTCMRCDWTSRDAEVGLGLLGAVRVPEAPKKS